MTNEQKREKANKFEEKLIKMQEEFGMELYPTNALNKENEVIPVIKFRFTRDDNSEKTVVEGEVEEVK